jgi:hypothetical protein
MMDKRLPKIIMIWIRMEEDEKEDQEDFDMTGQRH